MVSFACLLCARSLARLLSLACCRALFPRSLSVFARTFSTTSEAGKPRTGAGPSRPSSAARSDGGGAFARTGSRTDRMMGTDVPLQIPGGGSCPPPDMNTGSNFVPPTPRGMEKFMQLYYAEESEGEDSSPDTVCTFCPQKISLPIT